MNRDGGGAAPAPVATYRLQLTPDFGFAEATELVPYLAALGISHIYTSPYLQAATGSMHGYDVVDPTRINEELGGRTAHAAFAAALAEAGLGHMVDIVPNHMAIAGRQNPWWWDVLENGPSSRFATYFDVDWEASEERWPNKVMLPVLGDHYGRILEAGELRLVHADGAFSLHHFEHVFPVDPSSLDDLLARAAETAGSDLLAFLGDVCGRLPRPTVTGRREVERRHRDKAVVGRMLARLCRENPNVCRAIDAEVSRTNGDPDLLDALVDSQNYRLAFWRTAGRDLGYRRFFDIHDLAGLRVEEEEVFHATHELPLRWVRDGTVQGLRVDHPDGLRDPAEYFQRLRRAAPEAWLVAEKILEPGEHLPDDWPVEGTTGYDFLRLVDGLFVDPRGEEPLTRCYAEFTGEEVDFGVLVRDCKREVLQELLASELRRLSVLFVEVCERHRRHRDYTRHELREALVEVAACFPVYRSYVRARYGAVSETDVEHVQAAVAQALADRPDLDSQLLDFLQDILLLRVKGERESELAMRFQQLTGPAMAKGLEDTAFYRYNRLLSLNEVGGDPGRFGTPVDEFHAACVDAQARRPRSLLATSTHDTKRSEDVRARLVLLSEQPERWAAAAHRWSAHNERHRSAASPTIAEAGPAHGVAEAASAGDDAVPDRDTEYHLYQVLAGAWPITAERAVQYMEKASREAKLHTSWTQQDEAWEQALQRFVRGILADRAFTDDLGAFVAPLVEPGRVNSLAETLLKLTAPGVPDIYQGTELWDLSLVDPDNRRAIDFIRRTDLLEELAGRTVEDVLGRADEGLPKLWLLHRALRVRRTHADLFGAGAAYEDLPVHGERADHAVAYLRGGGAAVLVPRLVLGLAGAWGDTVVELTSGRWRDALTDSIREGGRLAVAEALDRFPVALLIREERS
ncbi:MAG: malto-oligosyltrehalose synthase [Candidatus Krumholzibacteriia bacterium]